jgi:hypothetical protein
MELSVMDLPFTVNEFLNVFERYNLSVWPAQLALYAFAIIALLCLYRNLSSASQVVFTVLSLLWAWMGLVYHISFFSSINKAAYIFGAFFLVQSFIFFYFGFVRVKIQLTARLHTRGIIGLVFIVYALIIYPLLGLLLDHIYPKSPTFGVPCPTTIFTFGLLLFSARRVPFLFLLIPLLWSVIGLSAAISLGVVEDIGLIISGVVSTTLLTLMRPEAQKSTK